MCVCVCFFCILDTHTHNNYTTKERHQILLLAHAIKQIITVKTFLQDGVFHDLVNGVITGKLGTLSTSLCTVPTLQHCTNVGKIQVPSPEYFCLHHQNCKHTSAFSIFNITCNMFFYSPFKIIGLQYEITIYLSSGREFICWKLNMRKYVNAALYSHSI